MNHRTFAVAAAAALTAVLAACGSEGTSSSSGGSCSAGTAAVTLGSGAVTIQATDQQTYSPSPGSANVGQIVQWTDTGTLMHSVTFDSSNAGCLTDVALNPGSTWQVKFSQAGTYTYHCTVHPGMNGSITVS